MVRKILIDFDPYGQETEPFLPSVRPMRKCRAIFTLGAPHGVSQFLEIPTLFCLNCLIFCIFLQKLKKMAPVNRWGLTTDKSMYFL